MRRTPTGTELVFIAAKNPRSAVLWADDEVLQISPETGGAAVQLTANDGVHASPALCRRLDDLTVSPDGARLAYTLNVGGGVDELEQAGCEDLLVYHRGSNSTVVASRRPTSGSRGVRQGSVLFTLYPLDGVVWVEGQDSLSTPTLGATAYWNDLTGNGAPLRLTPTTVYPRQVLVLGWSPLNP